MLFFDVSDLRANDLDNVSRAQALAKTRLQRIVIGANFLDTTYQSIRPEEGEIYFSGDRYQLLWHESQGGLNQSFDGYFTDIDARDLVEVDGRKGRRLLRSQGGSLLPPDENPTSVGYRVPTFFDGVRFLHGMWLVDLIGWARPTLSRMPSGNLELKWKAEGVSPGSVLRHKSRLRTSLAVEIDPRHDYMAIGQVIKSEESSPKGIYRVFEQRKVLARERLAGVWLPSIYQVIGGTSTSTIELKELRKASSNYVFSIVRPNDVIEKEGKRFRYTVGGEWEPIQTEAQVSRGREEHEQLLVILEYICWIVGAILLVAGSSALAGRLRQRRTT